MQDPESLSKLETATLPEVSSEGVQRVIKNAARILNRFVSIDSQILEYDIGIPAPQELRDSRTDLQQRLVLLTNALDEILPTEEGYWAREILSRAEKMRETYGIYEDDDPLDPDVDVFNL